MYIEPIDDRAARAALPRRASSAIGANAWGRAGPRRGRYALAWLEFALLFAVLPLVILILGEAAAPFALGASLSAATVLLSVTRGFHWRDLAPVDPLSEARLFLQCAAGIAAAAIVVTAVAAPQRLFATSDVPFAFAALFPALIALPYELIHRALFFRRYTRLFRSEAAAIAVGAAVNGLVYGAMIGTVGGGAFGAALSFLLGWVYLRTGQFALCVLLHWIAALSVWLIGPGF